MAIINCEAANAEQRIDYYLNNKPVKKNWFDKSIAAIDAKLDNVVDWANNVIFSKLKFGRHKSIVSNIENSNFKFDENGRLKGDTNEETEILNMNTQKQETTGDEHTGFLAGMIETFKRKLIPFSTIDSNRYEVQYALTTLRESYNVAFDSITKKLNYLYNQEGEVSVDTLQKVAQAMLTGTVLDNYTNDMNLPMQDEFYERMKNNPETDLNEIRSLVVAECRRIQKIYRTT